MEISRFRHRRNRFDMIEEAKFAFFKHRDAGGSLWMDSFLAMLQRGNEILERYFTGKRFGRIEAGYEADLTFWDYDPPTPLSAANLAGHGPLASVPDMSGPPW
jgi:cytosine/adenosine deaminase-related metal-dependent hydrolase